MSSIKYLEEVAEMRSCAAAFPSATAGGCMSSREGPSSAEVAEIALADAEEHVAVHFELAIPDGTVTNITALIPPARSQA